MFRDNKMIRSYRCGLEPFDKIMNLVANIAMKNFQASLKLIHLKISKNIMDIYDSLNLGENSTR